MPQVTGDIYCRHRDQPADSWVLRAVRQERRDSLTNCLGDAVWTPRFAHTASSGLRGLVECAGHFLGPVALEHVANLHVVEVLNADAALVAFLHFVDVI